MTLWVINCRGCFGLRCPLLTGEFNRSTQHPSLERTDCWCRSNFSIKGQDIRHRSRSFERLRRYPPVLAALPALSALCLQLQHEPCPCMSLHMHAIPTWRIRVKGCCVDRLSPPPESRHSPRLSTAYTRMCGRATYKLTWEEIVTLYRLTLDQPPVNTRARYNVCPTTTIDTILDQDGKRRLERMRWGLVPSWWSKPLNEMKLATFNARAETVATNRCFGRR